jgi:UDP-N-acetylmuramoylalanine--D-glutamate ligase
MIYETTKVSEAVEKGLKLAAPGEVVLLSPACASFDLFKNYMDRGDQFKEQVRLLKNNQKNKLNFKCNIQT